MKPILHALCLAMSVTVSIPAYAGIEVVGTRVVYHGRESEEAVRVNNVGTDPVLLQVWLDKTKEQLSAEKEDVPFVFTPPMARINKNKAQVIRVFQTPEAKTTLPQDRESLYWINFLEVPPKAENDTGENKLGIAIRTRLKFIYRPAAVPDELVPAAEKLVWSVKKDGNKYIVTCNNPTPYVFSFAQLQLKSRDATAQLEGGTTKPMEKENFELEFDPSKTIPASTANIEFTYKYISDLGAFVEKTIQLDIAR